MIVFKAYFKVLRASLPIIIMYFMIFLAVAILVGSLGSQSNSFVNQKPKVLIINNDDSQLTKTFIHFVKENALVVKLANDKDVIKDALFYREIEYVMEIPANYGRDFMNGQAAKIKTTSIPNSSSNAYTTILFNRFFSICQTYLAVGMTEEQIVTFVLNDLKDETKVTLLDDSKKDIEKISTFYNYTNYTILAAGILVISMIVNVFTKENIKKRSIISATSYQKINLALTLGNLCLILLIWLSYLIVGVILYKNVMLSMNGILFALNSLSFCLMVLTLGFLVGNLVRNKEAQNGVVNLVALGTSFICGAFVPQMFLGSFVTGIARFLPSYWYIANNNQIALLSNFNYESLMPIFRNMGIIILLAIIFIIINNIVSKVKLKRN